MIGVVGGKIVLGGMLSKVGIETYAVAAKASTRPCGRA